MAIPRVLNQKQVEKVFGVSHDTIRRMVKAGKLRRIKLGLQNNGYLELDVERAFRELRREAQQ